jgi:hypothetical protein
MLLRRAKANWSRGREREFVATLKEAEKKVQEALDYLPDNPFNSVTKDTSSFWKVR